MPKRSNVALILKARGYRITGMLGSRYCFDYMARRREELIALKAAEDASVIGTKILRDLSNLGNVFGASSIIVSEQKEGEDLEEDVVYSHQGLPLLSPRTFVRMIRGASSPLVYVSRGGVYVKINPEAMKQRREELGLTLGDLAYELGVNRRTVYGYERGETDVSLSVACRLERILGESVFEDLSPKSLRELSKKLRRERKEGGVPGSHKLSSDLEKIFYFLSQLGFRSFLFTKSPFDAASFKEEEDRSDKIVLKRVDFDSIDDEDVRITTDVARVTGSKAVIISPGSRDVEKLDDDVFVVPKDLDTKKLERIIEEG